MERRPYVLHALSPLHAGTGQGADLVDLPIARMKATGIPLVPGSTIKGVLREARAQSMKPGEEGKLKAVFGPAPDDERDPSAPVHAGALVVSDARLLALPVRSLQGTFAWVSSPLLLELARRDFDGVLSCLPAVPRIDAPASVGYPSGGSDCLYGSKVYLEDLDLTATEEGDIDEWAGVLAPCVAGAAGNAGAFSRRFLVTNDSTMDFLWATATQVDSRVRIDQETRVAAEKMLWIEESLPPETLLLGVLFAEGSRRPGVNLPPMDVLDFALHQAGDEVLQFGGKATVGRGICRIVPVPWMPPQQKQEVRDGVS